jgi:uridylate kinase
MGRRGDPYATDTLLDLLRKDGGPVDPRDYDLIFACGEAISVAVMAQTLRRQGIPAIALTSVQARIYTDGNHLEAEVTNIETSRLRSLLAAGEVPVITGGQGVAPDTLDFATLGRGGSDTSGVAVGVFLGAEKVEIFTDVEGVLLIDPRLVPGAPMLRRISYASMYELARFGAKVVHPRAIMTGWRGHVPIVVRSTFSTDPGTLIGDVADEQPVVGIAALPPMRTVALPAGGIDDARRELWERRHLVMSIADWRTGQLLVGAPADKANELEAVLKNIASDELRQLGICCWASFVGDDSRPLAESHPALLGPDGRELPVLGCELASRRCTYIVSDDVRNAALTALYRTVSASMSGVTSSPRSS